MAKYNPYSICSDREFDRTRAAVKAKKIQLKKSGLGRKQRAAEAITQDEEGMLLEGSDSLFDLQFCLFYFFTKGFGLRGCDEHRRMQFGDVSIQQTSAGQRFL